MDDLRFDLLTRGISALLSRRTLAAGLGLATLVLPVAADAKKKRKRKKKKKVKKNQFGCVDVGKFCKNSGQCCSGICKGKKGKKKCKAHDEGGCQAQQPPLCEGADTSCTTSAGVEGECLTTTGKAGYCFASADCFSCQKDADCVAVCGPQAACVVCSDACEIEGGTACVGPAEGDCPGIMP